MLTANDYYRARFGGKVYRISLNGGMSCPNRDGTLDTGGCIFCSRGGSGDFAASATASLKKGLNTLHMRLERSFPCNPKC